MKLVHTLVCCISLAAGMLSFGVNAQVSYTVKVNPTLNGLNVALEPVSAPDVLIMKIANKSDKKIRCDFAYDAQPQRLKRTSTFVKAGETGQNVFKAADHWTKVNVDVTCVAL
jgi:hypothetical protein